MMLFLITAMLLLFDVGNVFVSVFSIVVIISILVTFKVAHGNILGLGFVFIAYNILMHFGFGRIHFLISDTVAGEIYASWSLAFLRSENYSKAIIISALAFEAFTIAWLLGLNKRQLSHFNDMEVTNTEKRENGVCYTLGILMLTGVLFYFIILLVMGRMSFNMSYTDYRDSVMSGNALYSWMLVFYPTGQLFHVV